MKIIGESECNQLSAQRLFLKVSDNKVRVPVAAWEMYQ